jgi:hypothetical protein
MTSDPAAAFLARLDSAQGRLAAHSAAPPAPGLTEPDPPSGERWEWGQVWAHLGEFVPYWADQVRAIVRNRPEDDPILFGRTKADPGRIAAIEEDRHRPASELMGRLVRQLDDLRSLIGGLRPEDWSRRGAHSTLGVMDLAAIVEEFLVRHLEAHTDQLDGLAAGVASPAQDLKSS